VLLAALALAAGAAAAGLAGSPELGEPLPLRWLRVALTHPFRTGLALFLLLLGLLGPDPSSDRGDRGEGDEAVGGRDPGSGSNPGRQSL
jgi:hypothetical protein